MFFRQKSNSGTNVAFIMYVLAPEAERQREFAQNISAILYFLQRNLYKNLDKFCKQCYNTLVIR